MEITAENRALFNEILSNIGSKSYECYIENGKVYIDIYFYDKCGDILFKYLGGIRDIHFNIISWRFFGYNFETVVYEYLRFKTIPNYER